MKIIHTSDWHLGHLLYHYDRTEEQTAFLNQLQDIVVSEQPDALLVCGDIYHTTTPSSATQKMYTEALLRIHKAVPEMQIVILAGNHDSRARLEVDQCLWQHFGVTIVGGIEKNEDKAIDWSRQIIPIRKQDGRTIGYIAAVPHIYPNNFPSMPDETEREERPSLFFKTLLKKVDEENRQKLPVVLAAHLTISGCTKDESQEKLIGGLESIALSELGDEYDYLALGHIHHPQQFVTGQRIARYCGTPIAVDFDEDYKHSISVVEINHKGEKPEIRTREIENPHPLTTFPKEAADLPDALAQLQDFPKERTDYIRLLVKGNKFMQPDALEKAIEATRNKSCRFCYIKIQKEETVQKDSNKELTIEELKQKSPMEIAQMYFNDVLGEPMDEALCQRMQKACLEVMNPQEEEF